MWVEVWQVVGGGLAGCGWMDGFVRGWNERKGEGEKEEGGRGKRGRGKGKERKGEGEREAEGEKGEKGVCARARECVRESERE